MQIEIGINTEDDRVLDKNFTPTSILQNVQFSGEASVVSPVFKITNDFANVNVNYLFCPELDRYYFVRDIKFVGHFAFLHCFVDVLNSNKSELFDCEVNVSRSFSEPNKYLNDTQIAVTPYKNTTKHVFPESFDRLPTDTNQKYAVILAGVPPIV